MVQERSTIARVVGVESAIKSCSTIYNVLAVRCIGVAADKTCVAYPKYRVPRSADASVILFYSRFALASRHRNGSGVVFGTFEVRQGQTLMIQAYIGRNVRFP